MLVNIFAAENNLLEVTGDKFLSISSKWSPPGVKDFKDKDAIRLLNEVGNDPKLTEYSRNNNKHDLVGTN